LTTKDLNNLKHYCVLPFNSVSISANGEIRHCCNGGHGLTDTFFVQDVDVNGLINNPFIHDIRESFLKDERHPKCTRCWEMEDMGVMSMIGQAIQNLVKGDVMNTGMADDYAVTRRLLQNQGGRVNMNMGGGLGSKQAIFETLSGNKIFKGFPLNSKFDLQGVTQFLNIGMSLRCTIVTHADNNFLTAITTDDVSKGGGIYYVGQIADPPSDIAPNVDLLPTAGGTEASHNWLVTKCDVEIIGSAMKQTVEFTLSGYLGWNRLIYNLNAGGFAGIADTRFSGALPTGGSSL